MPSLKLLVCFSSSSAFESDQITLCWRGHSLRFVAVGLLGRFRRSRRSSAELQRPVVQRIRVQAILRQWTREDPGTFPQIENDLILVLVP